MYYSLIEFWCLVLQLHSSARCPKYTRVLTKKYHEVIDNSYTADSASDVEAHSTVGLPSELAMTRTLGGL